MSMQLNETEVRVLGCLVEKQLTTPEYYPLTLNALTAACDQKTNRDPVMSLSESEVQAAAESLRDANLVYLFYGSGSRVVKYKHMMPGALDIDPAGTAVLTSLMLRGPQTVGEIKGSTGRLWEFADLGQVETAIEELSRRDEPLVVRLERLPGQKEARYAHLLSGMPVIDASAAVPPQSTGRAADRISGLEEEVRRISAELDELKRTVDEFRKQFE